jgi:hypothetical protein
VGFVANKVALGQVFSEYFGFPCQFSFYQILHTHLYSGAGTIGQLGQLVAEVPCGLCPRPLQTHTKKKSSVSRISEMNAFKYSRAAENSPKISFKVTENG